MNNIKLQLNVQLFPASNEKMSNQFGSQPRPYQLASSCQGVVFFFFFNDRHLGQLPIASYLTFFGQWQHLLCQFFGNWSARSSSVFNSNPGYFCVQSLCCFLLPITFFNLILIPNCARFPIVSLLLTVWVEALCVVGISFCLRVLYFNNALIWLTLRGLKSLTSPISA